MDEKMVIVKEFDCHKQAQQYASDNNLKVDVFFDVDLIDFEY